ncbi:MAG TPA: PAC2 family protein [Candidatus Omnitrophota bacterium]|nr:PAC2 family protein [Candidatus Omnitrophota bacterium]HQQ05749.1 PAC2 family protein [Candidatus Omnitrophota bacterium]
MERIKFTRNPKLKSPLFIVAWPGMGEVAFKAAAYLVDKLKAEAFARIPAQDFFYMMESYVHEGIISLPDWPSNKFYFYKGKGAMPDLVVFIADAQPDLARAEDYCRLILEVAKKYKARKVISFAAMPQAIDHSQPPNVWFTATSDPIKKELMKHNVQMLNDGHISGLNGLFLGMAKRAGLDGFCLLGEIPLYTIQIENPKASYVVLEALCRITGITLDFSDLREQAAQLDGQINNLLEYLKLGPTPGPIGEDEIDKIRKSLSQLTKLPLSVQQKIEELFTRAKTDISRANELKTELDKWNVYKDYEDRFLDLFKKKKESNN